MKAADPSRQPSPGWYFRRAVYVSRRDYRRIFMGFLSFGVPMAAVGLTFGVRPLFHAALVMAAVGLLLLVYSLIGLYRMYGHPSMAYFRRLLEMGKVTGAVTIADLHIGTYRHAFALAGLLPAALIESVDIWNAQGPPAEEAVQDVRALEPPPQGHPRIRPSRAPELVLPLPAAHCDVVVLGFGTHEIPAAARPKLMAEVRRVLKPGGKVLMFEHGYDWHNYLIFGPVIDHVTRKQAWVALLRQHFDDVCTARTSQAVDLFAAVRRD
jgi:SAM-dependent methyltransferase